MKIAYITAGAAGMYCGSCMHDNTLVRSLQALGCEAILLPTYTPIRTDELDISNQKVFMGGINVYLQQKFPIFRKTPGFLDRLFDSPWLLKFVSRFASSTNARDLGALTVSILKGDHGHQAKEVDKLAQWLAEHYQPDLVQLTNAMFLGLAEPLKKRLGVPVICSLQGEDIFLDDLIEPFKTEAFQEIARTVEHLDGFVASSSYYAEYMSQYLQIDSAKIHTVPLGVSTEGLEPAASPPPDEPFTVGYLARICPEKGLHQLIQAFRIFASEVGPQKVRLLVAGYLGARDKPYLAHWENKLDQWGLKDAYQYLGEVDRQGKDAFFHQCHVFSVPTTYREPKGLSILEAFACGIPVVQPAHGAFPQMVKSSGGGLLVEPECPEALAEALMQMYNDKAARRQMGAAGREAVVKTYNAETMAANTLALYRQFLLDFKAAKC